MSNYSSTYMKTMDTDTPDAEAVAVAPEKSAPQDQAEALRDLHVEELRIIAREKLGASAWISVARKERLITALVTGHFPHETAIEDAKPAAPTPAAAPAANAELADLLAKAVAKHMPTPGLCEKMAKEVEVIKKHCLIMREDINSVQAQSHKVDKGLLELFEKHKAEQEKAIHAEVEKVVKTVMEAMVDRIEGFVVAKLVKRLGGVA